MRKKVDSLNHPVSRRTPIFGVVSTHINRTSISGAETARGNVVIIAAKKPTQAKVTTLRHARRDPAGYKAHTKVILKLREIYINLHAIEQTRDHAPSAPQAPQRREHYALFDPSSEIRPRRGFLTETTSESEPREIGQHREIARRLPRALVSVVISDLIELAAW